MIRHKDLEAVKYGLNLEFKMAVFLNCAKNGPKKRENETKCGPHSSPPQSTTHARAPTHFKPRHEQIAHHWFGIRRGRKRGPNLSQRRRILGVSGHAGAGWLGGQFGAILANAPPDAAAGERRCHQVEAHCREGWEGGTEGSESTVDQVGREGGLVEIPISPPPPKL